MSRRSANLLTCLFTLVAFVTLGRAPRLPEPKVNMTVEIAVREAVRFAAPAA